MSLTVARILHAGYLFSHERTTIVFDPLFENPFSRNCFAFPDVTFLEDRIRASRFDAVFISHYHDDHCSFASLDWLARSTPIYMYCVHDKMFDWLRELGFTDVRPVELDRSITVGSIEIIPRRALDRDVDAMFQVRAGGVNVLNVVDAWIDDDTLALLVREGPWDMVLWPFQTMRELEVIAPRAVAASKPEIPPEGIAQLRALAPRFIVPSSCQFRFEDWSWVNLAFFPISYRYFAGVMAATVPESRVVRLNPSVAVSLSPVELTEAPRLDWVVPRGDPDVDYAYDAAVTPTAMSVVARRFEALTPARRARVDRYCRVEIPRRYAELTDEVEPYFARPRVWALRVYDHAGDWREFRYRLAHGAMTRIETAEDTPREPLGWFTEIAGARLYGALADGESLTSLGLRINDVDFGPELGAEVRACEITADPLLRCLYAGVFGGYQRAQLDRLMGVESREP